MAYQPTAHQADLRGYQYDAIIDLMIAEPNLYYADIAAKLGRSVVWVRYITNSDVFKSMLAKRQAEKADVLNSALNHKLQGVALKSLELLQERLEKNPSAISTPQVMDISSKTLERLGYGVKPINGGTQVFAAPGSQVAVLQASPEGLANARELIRKVEDIRAQEAALPVAVKTPVTIDVEPS